MKSFILAGVIIGIIGIIVSEFHSSKLEELATDKVIEPPRESVKDSVGVVYLGRSCDDNMCLYFYEINGKMYAANYRGGLIELK